MLVEYGGSRFVFPNPTDLAGVAVVSENNGDIIYARKYVLGCFRASCIF
jgi:hypothetical protein